MLKIRKAKAKEAHKKMAKIWRSNSIPLKLKLRILKATCFPILLYGSETWTINREIKNKINSFATTCYRSILGISKFEKQKNEEILRRVNERELIKTVEERQKNFIIKTLNSNETIIKRYLTYDPSFGITKRGRTQKLYKQYVKELLVGQADILVMLANI